MARRKVTGCRWGRGGEILGLFGPSFGYRSKEDILDDLLSGREQYYVREAPHESELRVVETDGGMELRTTSNPLSHNHLKNLRRR